MLFFTQGKSLGFPRLSHFGYHENTQETLCTPPHVHYGYELIYVERGNAQATLEDGLTNVAVRARDLVLFAPGYEHQFTRQPQNAHYWLGLQTGPRVVDVGGGAIAKARYRETHPTYANQAIGVRNEPDNPYQDIAPGLPPTGFRVLHNFPVILPILRDLFREVQVLRADTHPMLVHLTGLLLLTVARGLVATPHEALVSRVKSEIDQNPGDDRSLSQIARDHGTHPSTLSKKFRLSEGTTPVAYRNDQRFREAFRLLSSGMRPSAVAKKLAFPDYPYFSRFFRARAGFSPNELTGRSGPPPYLS